MSCVEKQFMSWNVLDSGIVSSVPFFLYFFFCFRIESFQMISNWVNYRGEFVEKANHQRKNGRKKAEFVFRNSNSTDFEADTIAAVVVVVIDIVDLKIEECKKSFKTRDIWLFSAKILRSLTWIWIWIWNSILLFETNNRTNNGQKTLQKW